MTHVIIRNRVPHTTAPQHAYVYIHDLVREGVAAADELRQQTGHGGGWGRGAKSGEAGPAMRRLRSWSFLQKLVVSFLLSLRAQVLECC